MGAESSIVTALASEAQLIEPEDGPAAEFADDAGVPVPSPALVHRAGSREVAPFRSIGGKLKELILDLLPDGWSFEGKRVLDFGCGAGRLLRHFVTEAETCEFHGCDIDAESIEWLAQHLCPPMHVFTNDKAPPLPFEDETLDLVIAASVFTHISDTWSEWLVEMHRVLRPMAFSSRRSSDGNISRTSSTKRGTTTESA